MAGKDIIMLSQEELKRLHVVKKILEGVLKQVEAAAILILSDRQVRRVVRKVKTEGDRGIIHGSRGRPSNNRFASEVKDRAIRLYQEKYNDFGPTLFSEKLYEVNGLKISDETLRNWLIQSGDWQKARKRKTHRKWPERKRHYGEMIQMDGSHHNWLEDRCPDELVLMGCIDDATNKIFGRFYEYEGTMPAMDCFKRYPGLYGLPISVYLDRHTTYKSNAKPTIEDDLLDRKPMSQFERAMEELGVRVIHALSPQAKGRIERLFKTLQSLPLKALIRGQACKRDAA